MSPRRRWTFGEVVFSRQRLGLQPDEVPSPAPAQGVWFELPVHVVEDGEGALVTFAAPGAPFTFPAGSWPSPNGLHPWHERSAWSGHGCLQVHVPGEHYAVWHFWDGPNRDFKCGI